MHVHPVHPPAYAPGGYERENLHVPFDSFILKMLDYTFRVQPASPSHKARAMKLGHIKLQS